MADDNSTIVITDIHKALESADQEGADTAAALLVIGGDLKGNIYDLLPGSYKIGRGADCEIQFEVDGISRNHFKIDVDTTGEIVKIQDLESRNGTFLNDDQNKINGQIELRQGDVIKFGKIQLKYIPKGDNERLTYDKLNMEANTDRHTGCYNKVYFNNALEKEFKKAQAAGSPLSLILFDLDHFKKLNDNYGHDAGDYVLKELANVIRKRGLRAADVFARYGGEEFVILMPKTNLKDGFKLAETLRRAVEAHEFIYDKKRLPVTASIGVSDYRSGVNESVDLFKRADEAVYKSKENGRNQVNFYKAS